MPTVAQLNQTHAEHKLFSGFWSMADVLNAGGVRVEMAAQELLIKKPKELFDAFSERIRRITYQNILGPALGWFSSALYKRNPQIDIKGGNGDWYNDVFLQNCDRKGTPFVDLCGREVFKHLFLYKKSYVLTDLPHAEFPVQTRADELDQGLDQPYIVVFDPRQVLNWGEDDAGNLTWIVFAIDTDSTKFLGLPTITRRWYYFDQTKFQIYEADAVEPQAAGSVGSGQQSLLVNASGRPIDDNTREAKLVTQGSHALADQNRVPVRRIAVPDELWMANRVYLQLKDHFNQDNTYSWALFNSNLAMPVIFSDKELRNLTMSETGFLQLGHQDKFEWSEPAGHSFEYSQARLESLREEIYRGLYLSAQGRSATASASSQSGYSKELDMRPANEVLNRFGDIMRAGMQQVGTDVSDARKDGAKWDVYGLKFETTPIVESISVGQMMSDFGILAASPTLETEVYKTVAQDYLEDRNDDIKAKVMTEIEKFPPQAVRADAKVQAQQQGFQQSFQRITSRAQVNSEQDALGGETSTGSLAPGGAVAA